jgi:hypothetical protein
MSHIVTVRTEVRDPTAVAPDRAVVRWEDRGIPQTREYSVTTLGTFPEARATFEPATAGLLDALAEASGTAAEDITRYALNCMQVTGTTHEIVAIDGRQLLIQGGFQFPFEGDLLVR